MIRTKDVRHPEDVDRLRAAIPELAGKTDIEIQDLYSDWSSEVWFAGWEQMNDWNIDRFAKCLRGEMTPAQVHSDIVNMTGD